MTDATTPTSPPTVPADSRAGSRYARGVELMTRVQGGRAAQQIRDGFDAISPDDPTETTSTTEER